MSASAKVRDPFAGGYVGKMPVEKKAESSALSAPAALYTEPDPEPAPEAPSAPEAPAAPSAEPEPLADFARRVAGFAPPEPKEVPRPRPAIVQALRELLGRLRTRLVRRFPHAVQEELREDAPEAPEAPEALARWVCTLVRGLAELDGTGSELAQHERVMAVVRPDLRVSGPMHVRLAPWVRASDVRADIADEESGRGIRLLAYALFDATQAHCAAHVVEHEGSWYLIVCATYSARAWHDAYGAMLHVRPRNEDPRGPSIGVYDPIHASVACEVGLVHLRLAPSAAVRLARVPGLSSSDGLALAMHLMRAARTMPIIPGSHVLAGLREFAATEGNDLLKLIEDPYERAFTTMHTRLSAFARTSLGVGGVGAYYGRVLLSLLRMFTSTDLEVDEGHLGVLIRATPSGHYRIESDVSAAVAALRDVLADDDVDAVGYMSVLYKFVSRKEFPIGTAAAEAKTQLDKVGAMAKKLEAEQKTALADSNSAQGKERTRGLLSRRIAAGGYLVGAGGALLAGAIFALPLAWGGLTAAIAAAAAAGGGGLAGVTAGTMTGASLIGLFTGLMGNQVAKGNAGLLGGMWGAAKGLGTTVSTYTTLAMHDPAMEVLGFSQSLDLVKIVPATELAYHVTRAVASAKGVIMDGAGDELAAAKWEDHWANQFPTGGAKVKSFSDGLPNLHPDIDELRGLYWMLVAMFVRLQLASVDEIAEGYKRHVAMAVRGHTDEIGVGVKTNATIGVPANIFALDSIPIGAFAYSRGESGAYAVMRRTGLDTFDEYAVREHDRAVRLEQNTIVAASELASRVAGGEYLYGPIYDANELIGPELIGPARRDAHRSVVSSARVTLAFKPAPMLPGAFAARSYNTRSLESYSAFVFALREKQRKLAAEKLGTFATKMSPFVGTAGIVGALSYAAPAALGAAALPLLVGLAVFAATAFGPDYATTSAWFPGTPENKRALYLAAQKEFESSPSLHPQLSQSMREALYTMGDDTSAPDASADGAAKTPIPIPIPFDYRSLGVEAMQMAKSSLPLAREIMRRL